MGIEDLLLANYPQIAAVGMAAGHGREPRIVDLRWNHCGILLYVYYMTIIWILLCKKTEGVCKCFKKKHRIQNRYGTKHIAICIHYHMYVIICMHYYMYIIKYKLLYVNCCV